MKILLLGSGGREHALAWKLAQSEKVEKIYVAPGNGGTAIENKCENLNLSETKDLIDFAKKENIDLTVVGPEDPLTKGIVNDFKKEGLKIFGPAANGAQLEGSKSFSKDFMKKYGVRTAAYGTFTKAEDALAYLETCPYPTVVKADGLAAGKGVIICQNKEEAIDAVNTCMVDQKFGDAGNTIVIEEFLEGFEASILSITDGKTIIPFVSGKDHKQIFDGGKGPNTGGMGVIAPNPFVTEEHLKDFEENIMKPTLTGIREEGFDFKGIIFFGVMINEKGVYLLEYNVRMGDPETQSVLYLMENDLVDLIEAALKEELDKVNVTWKEGYAINVVLASKGYPGSYPKGYEITIDEKVKNNVFLAGAKYEDGVLKTNGGRVLSVVGYGKTLEEARKEAYDNIQYVDFKDKYFRTDVGTFK